MSKLSKSILRRQLRFKDGSVQFPKWNNKKLGEICEIIGGGTPHTNNNEFWNGNIQWFTPTEIKSNSVHKSERTITQLGLKNSSAKILPTGTVLLTTRATIGEAAIAKIECTTNQGFQSLVAKENINNIFVFNWVKENKNELIKRAKGSTFPEISKSDLSNIAICVPCLSEQNKIANCLSSIDDSIEIEQSILDRWLLQKKILLSNLFI